MLFLATFFPTSDDDDDLFYDKEIPFEAVTEFLKLTVDLADLVGIYFVMQRVAGKGQVKVHFLTLACLVWLWMRREVSGFGNNTRGAGTSSGSRMFQHLFPLVVLLTIICSYKTLLLDLTTNAFELGSWTSLALKAFLTTSLGLITLQIYVGITTVLERH